MSKNNAADKNNNPSEILRQKGLKPRKGLGQNFLINESSLQQILTSSNLQNDDQVIEVGSGLGVLTLPLSQKVCRVIAVEKDESLANQLTQMLQTQGIKNVSVVCDDILKTEAIKMTGTYKVVANLPYYITNPVIMRFLESPLPPSLMVLMVQKEVAHRICAQPPNMNKLAAFCQYYGTPQIIKIVPKEHFWPVPKVDSAIIRLTPHQAAAPSLIEDYTKVIKAGFSQPRKQLINNFSAQWHQPKERIQKWLQDNQIDPKRRAESLRLAEWHQLARHLINIS